MCNCKGCENYSPTKELYLTEFQKLIVNCKPEINKPVFVLCGAGTGKTFALNERAETHMFLYYHPYYQLYQRTCNNENLNSELEQQQAGKQ